MRFILASLLAAVTAPIVIAIPHPDIPNTANDIQADGESRSGLIPRDDIPNEQKVGYLIFSNGCISTGSGWPSCKDTYTMKWGKEGDYKSCDDKPVDSAFHDLCKIKDGKAKLDTPMGEAFFQPDTNCGKGDKKGILVSTDSSKLFMYECVKDEHQFSEWCGFTWASSSIMKCTLRWK